MQPKELVGFDFQSMDWGPALNILAVHDGALFSPASILITGASGDVGAALALA